VSRDAETPAHIISNSYHGSFESDEGALAATGAAWAVTCQAGMIGLAPEWVPALECQHGLWDVCLDKGDGPDIQELMDNGCMAVLRAERKFDHPDSRVLARIVD